MSAWFEGLSQSPANSAFQTSTEEMSIPIRVLSADSDHHHFPATNHQLSTIHKQLQRKLRRFLFEQRSRVLARISRCSPALPADLLDLDDESNRIAVIKLPPETGDAEAGQFRESLLHQVRLIQEDLSASRASAVAARETPEQLVQRIRSIYNDAARAASVPIRQAIVPAKSSSTNK